MNANEGLLRIAKVLRGLGYVFGAITFACGVLIAIMGHGSDRMHVAVAAIIFAFVLVGVGWVLAWIVEGFAKEKLQ